MCCTTQVYPLDKKLAVPILIIGQFLPIFWDTTRDVRDLIEMDAQDVPASWVREIPEEGCRVTVNLVSNKFEAKISPAISAADHHIGKRITAGVYFEIAAKYAEKIDGEIKQLSTVTLCRPPEGSESSLLLAHYPELPMDFSRICVGFQSVMLPQGHSHDDG